MCHRKRAIFPTRATANKTPTQEHRKTTITQKTAFLSQLTVAIPPHPSFYLSVLQWSPYFDFCPKWEVGHL